jgi:hypothetical protein
MQSGQSFFFLPQLDSFFEAQFICWPISCFVQNINNYGSNLSRLFILRATFRKYVLIAKTLSWVSSTKHFFLFLLLIQFDIDERLFFIFDDDIELSQTLKLSASQKATLQTLFSIFFQIFFYGM